MMGTSEDKVKLLSKDQIEAPFPDVEVEDENREEDSGHIWRFVCYALAYMVVVGVFLSAITFQNSSTDEQSFSRDAGYKARVRQIRPGERFDDRRMHDMRMREEHRHAKMFPMFKPPPLPESSYDPPSRFEKAKTARYIVHNSDWGSISTISVSMVGVPFGMAISFSDGTVTNSTGVPYFYVAKFDPIVKNIEANNLSTLALSEAQSDYCKVHKWDPEDPLCSRVTLIGKLVHVGPEEEKFALNAILARHPVMKTWPKDHGWQTLKLVITDVWLVDFYGGATMVPVKDYFKAEL